VSEPRAGALRVSVVDPSGGEREAIALRVADEDGGVGWGEASPLPGYSDDDLDTVEAALDEWAAARERGDVADVPERLPSARCAIDTARLDLAARRRGLPLHELLLEGAAPVRTVGRVRVAALVSLAGVARPGAPPPAGSALRAVTDCVAVGFKTVKLKIGGADFDAELEQLVEIRAAFPFLRLRLDANGAWTPEDAIGRLAELERRVGPELVEQPVGPAELLSFTGAAVPIAADETMRLPGALERLAETGGCAAVVLKPMVLGGPTACFRLGRRALEHGMGAIVTHTFGGPIAHATACELALALAAIDPIGGAPAAGLAGHDDLPQRQGPWITPAAVLGHGVDRPW